MPPQGTLYYHREITRLSWGPTLSRHVVMVVVVNVFGVAWNQHHSRTVRDLMGKRQHNEHYY